MRREQYELMYQQEERHWWYAGMRRISIALLDRYVDGHGRGLVKRREILDAGCGSGGMTRVLERYGRVTGVDLAAEAIELARHRGLRRLARGSVGALPLADASFDLVTSFDVLYHLAVEDDRAAFAELHRVLRPGGVLLIRLPAYDWLRGAHDRAVHTRHRYTRGELTSRLGEAGFAVEHTSYANFLLFPLAPAKRLLERHSDSDGGGLADLWQPPTPINRALDTLLGLEAGPASRFGLPWGLSVYAVGRRVRGTACKTRIAGDGLRRAFDSEQQVVAGSS